MAHLLFVKLGDEELTDGNAIDGLVPGTFVDMYGRKIEIKSEDIPEIYANTQEAIAATEAESGELVGLPIDAQNHEDDDAAGWVVGVELEGDLIRLVVKWTALGVELIGEKKRRYFSATIDLGRNVIQGGSLTNWPATRDIETGHVLLRPVELACLSQDVFKLEDESLDETTQRVRQAWYSQEHSREGEESWAVEVFDDYVIIERATDGYFKVAFSEDEGEYTFAEQAEWAKVKKSWIELARETARRILAQLTGKEVSIEENESNDNDDNELGADDPSATLQGDKIMTKKLEELFSALSAESQTTFFATLAAKLGVSPEPATLTNVEAPIAQLQEHIREEAVKLADEIIAEAGREAEIVQLASGMVGGTEKNTAGLPVTEDAMVAFLKSLDEGQREAGIAILEKIRAEGLVGFSEKGHKKRVEGKTELDGEVKVLLKSYLKEDGEGSVAEFFEVNAADLGPMDDYDLAEFAVTKKEGE